MRRGSFFLIGLVCALILITACSGPAKQSPSPKGGVAVLFDGVALLSDQKVYFYGSPVGEIVGPANNAMGVTKLVVRLQPEFAAREGCNLAFYVNAGRLEAATLTSLGRSLESDTLLSGFTSKSGLQWFKLKTLLSDRINSAGQRAEELNRRLG